MASPTSTAMALKLIRVSIASGLIAAGLVQLHSMKARALLAWNMRRVRVASGISQERLAADAAVDRAYLGGLERQTENPTIDLVDRVAAALSVPMTELFVEPAEGESPPAPLRGGRKRS